MAMFRKETTVFSIRKAVGSIDNAQFLRQSCTYWVEDGANLSKTGFAARAKKQNHRILNTLAWIFCQIYRSK